MRNHKKAETGTKWHLLFLFMALMIAPGCEGTSSPTPLPDRPLFLVHYMPWYQTPEVSGYWGWHWKMDHFDPNQVNADGQLQIASHYMPLTGPYDSKDAALLEYQTLLMKISGIDGVIVDWYGTSNHADYPVINQATGKLFEAIKKAGLLFSICYEDQTVTNLIEAHKLDDVQDTIQGQSDLAYMETTWFQEEAYLKWNDQPVFFNFGPQYYKTPAAWETLFENLEQRPVLITLDQHYVPAATATFPWPPMWSSKEGVLSQAALASYLDGFYQKAKNYEYRVAGAFPGFHDIYAEAGVGSSYGFLDAQDGGTFELTLQKAIEQDPDVIQLITWNDYGEGTNLEPTVEYGYRYLEMIQAARAQLESAKPRYSSQDLRLPMKLFELRKRADDAETLSDLDEASEAILGGNMKKAAEILAKYP